MIKKLMVLCLTFFMVFGLAGCGNGATDDNNGEPEYTLAPDGEYEGVAAGMHGDVKVKVVVESDKIASIEILEHSENMDVAAEAIEKIPEALVASNGEKVDAITNATVTSEAIMSAVENALASATDE